MPSKRKDRGKVRTTWDFLSYMDFTSPKDGYGLPRRLRAEATDDPKLPGVVVVVDIEVENGRARAQGVSVSTDRPGGIGWTVLATVPTRDIVATAVLTALHRMEPTDKGSFQMMQLDETADVDEVRQIVQSVVGYSPDTERFERVAS